MTPPQSIAVMADVGSISRWCAVDAGLRKWPFASYMLSGYQELRKVKNSIRLDVERYVSEELGMRRFRWSLKAPGEPPRPSTESFATQREAVRDGQLALQRAIQKGRIGR